MYIVHGLGEYSGRWAEVANEFNQAGLRVHSIDFPGHGETLGSNKGHVGNEKRISSLIDLLLSVDEQVNVPKFLVFCISNGSWETVWEA